jgi:hypothetical protein
MSFPACSSLISLREGLTAFSHKNSFAELNNWILQYDKSASMDSHWTNPRNQQDAAL